MDATLRASVKVSSRVVVAAAGQPLQHAPPDHQPNAKRRVQPSRQQQHRPRTDKSERGGLARRERHAMHGKPALARQRLHAGVVAAAAGAADRDDGVRAFRRQCGAEIAAGVVETRRAAAALDIARHQARGGEQ